MDGPSKNPASARMEPKYTHYAPHGCGRDSYIITNNGGFLPMSDNTTFP